MADDQAMPPKQLTFTFRYDQNYRIVAANGVWVGMTPRGDVRFDFFVESQEAPKQVVHAIEDGQVGKMVERTPPDDLAVIRSVQCGVLLSLTETENLLNLLTKQVKTWKEAFKREVPDA